MCQCSSRVDDLTEVGTHTDVVEGHCHEKRDPIPAAAMPSSGRVNERKLELDMGSATELLDGLPTELKPDIAGAYLGCNASAASLTEITGVREIGPRRPGFGAVNGPPTPRTPFVGRGVPGFDQRRRAERPLSGECRISDAKRVPWFAFVLVHVRPVRD